MYVNLLKSHLFTKHIAIQSSLSDQLTFHSFFFFFFSGFKSKQLKSSSVEKRLYTHLTVPAFVLYNSLSLATRMCVSMSHISALCVHINLHTTYTYAHVCICVVHLYVMRVCVCVYVCVRVCHSKYI